MVVRPFRRDRKGLEGQERSEVLLKGQEGREGGEALGVPSGALLGVWRVREALSEGREGL